MRTFFGGDWRDHLHITLPYQDQARVASCLAANLSTLANEPCPFVPGKTLRETHFVFLGLSNAGTEPLTLSKLDTLLRDHGRPLLSELSKASFADSFATTTQADTCLYVTPCEYPFDELDYKEQLQKLPEGYVASTAIEAAQAQLLSVIKSGKFFAGNHYGRCADRDNKGRRLMIGNGESDGLHITTDSANIPGCGIGIAVHRKIPLPEACFQRNAA